MQIPTREEELGKKARVRGIARRVRADTELALHATRALLRAARLVRRASPDLLIRRLTAAAAHDASAPVDAHRTREIAEIARAIRILGRAFGRRRCLIEALAAAELMRARHLPCTLRFSVSRDRGTLHAHAWLESGGLVVIGDGKGAHAPLERAASSTSAHTETQHA